MREPSAQRSALLSAYEAACYEVELDDTVLTLRTGQPLPTALGAWFEAGRIEDAAFLSAANPRSRAMTAEQNSERHARLLSVLDDLGVHWLAGFGRDPTGVWEAEKSVLALQLPRRRAMHLAVQFEQYAYLEVVPREPVKLMLTEHWSSRRS